jgi:hypothetical protein
MCPSASPMPPEHPPWVEGLSNVARDVRAPHRQPISYSEQSGPGGGLHPCRSSRSHPVNAYGSGICQHCFCASKALLPLNAEHRACLFHCAQHKHQQCLQSVQQSDHHWMARGHDYAQNFRTNCPISMASRLRRPWNSTMLAFHSQYSAANAPKVVFRCIENCAKIAILGQNPYTDHQLINNAIHLLLTTGLYQRPFEEWDRLLLATQTWVALQALIQEAFSWHLNMTAPTAGHHGYAPTHPYQQNAFGILGKDDDDDKVNAVATQVAALTYQSQLTQSTAANTSQHQEQQMAKISAIQDATHATLHQLIDGMSALAFNMSNAGCGWYVECGYDSRGRGRGCMQGRGRGPPAYVGGVPHNGGFLPGSFPPTMGYVGSPMGAPHGPPGGFSGGNAGGPGGPPPYHAPPAMNGGYGPTGGYGMPPGHPGMSPGAQDNIQPPYSNVVKQYANWNTCYLCVLTLQRAHKYVVPTPLAKGDTSSWV